MARFWSWLSLFALVKARTSVICPLTEEDAIDQFNVLCTSTQPCENVDIFCPANAYTDILWVDCNGARACANMTVYSSVSSRVRCRGRTDACVGVQFYCGDVKEAVEEQSPSNAALFDGQNDGSDSISCKFRHLAPRVTQQSFFGCYGDQIGECTLKSIADDAFTNGQIYCGTTNGIPCNMECLTASSCANNEFECATDPNQCQCEPASNCASVLLTTDTVISTTTIPITTTSQTETTATSISTTAESTDLPPEARQPTFYYVSMESDDYLNTMILAANRCNVYQEQSFKVGCSDVDTGVNTGMMKYFSDEYCTEPITNSDSSDEYTCILINNEAKTKIASISRYMVDDVNMCTNENKETIMASAVERSTYYLSVGNCVAYSNEESSWHQYACSEGVLVDSIYNADDCSDESLISSTSFTDGECVVEHDVHAYYWQVNCSVRGDLLESSSTTTTAIQTTQSTIAETTTSATTASSTTEEPHSSTDVSTTTTERQTSSTEATETTSATTETETSTSTSVSTSESSVESTSTTAKAIETTEEEFGQRNSSGSSSKGLETWQLALVVVLSCVIALLGAFFIVIAVRRLRKSNENKGGQLPDEENQLMKGTQDSQLMEPEMSRGDGFNKSVSAQSRDLPAIAALVSPSEGDKPIKLETNYALPTPSEGDKITTRVGPATLTSPSVPSEGDATGKAGVDQV